MSIDKIVGADRRKLDEKNQWTVMTMIVSEDGIMTTDFDYSDISENAIAYEKNWKEKYIKQQEGSRVTRWYGKYYGFAWNHWVLCSAQTGFVYQIV